MGMVAAAGVSAAIYFAWMFYYIPDTAHIAAYRPATATRVFAWDGTLIGEYSDQRRIYVPYDQMPPQLVNAFLAAEDRNFYHHGGVDVSGLGRAMFKDVLNLAQGRRLEGGSTITQQVAKNILVGNDSTIGRKLKEAVVAGRLEKQLTKQHILELYLNEIWLGYRSYGVAIAAYNYFGKSLNQLTLPECAYLAALPKGPDNYDPKDRKAQAISRRNWILDQMVETGAVTRADAEAAKKTDLVVQPGPSRARYSYADFFVEEVRRTAESMFGIMRQRLLAFVPNLTRAAGLAPEQQQEGDKQVRALLEDMRLAIREWTPSTSTDSASAPSPAPSTSGSPPAIF